MVARSPALTCAPAGSGTCGRHTVPGYGLFDGPRSWNGGTMGCDMLGGPPPGPSVPKPRFTYSCADEWPWNQPGWKATAPPVVGQYVLFFVVGTPPPAFLFVSRASSRPLCVQSGGVEEGRRRERGDDRGGDSGDDGDRNVQGYSHCIPYGCDEFVMRLFPLDPGYEMRMCACTAAAATSAVNMLPSMVSFFYLAPVLFLNRFKSPSAFDPGSFPRNSLRGGAAEGFAPIVQDTRPVSSVFSRSSFRGYAARSVVVDGTRDSR